jgi:hypothetical protein
MAERRKWNPLRRTRATRVAARSLRWVKDVLSRSIQLQHKRAQAQGAEKGRGPAAEPAMSLLMEQRADLGARLLVHDPATQLVRNLFVIHDELGKQGWTGVSALPRSLIGRALTEAEILNQQEPSSLLMTIIETLRSIKIAAEARAAQAVQDALEKEWEREEPAIPEVSETNYDEYELMERSWIGTVPAGLDLSERSLPSR